MFYEYSFSSFSFRDQYLFSFLINNVGDPELQPYIVHDRYASGMLNLAPVGMIQSIVWQEIDTLDHFLLRLLYCTTLNPSTMA
jgi:hypothetical protein